MADEFHHLADYLGDEHDLAVLRERLSESAMPLIRKRSEELQNKAFALGERLYADKSKTFLSDLEKHWTQWQRQEQRNT
jgi:hypothetical protein